MKNLAIAVVLILGVFAISANLENETKIGYVDKAYVMGKLPEYQKAKHLLENFENDNTKELSKADAEISNLFAAIEELKSKGDDSREQQLKLVRKIESYEKNKVFLKEKIKAEKTVFWKKHTKEVKYRVKDAMNTAAGKNGYTHVFDKSLNGESDLLIAPIGDDLTPKVMDILELKYEDYKVEK